jgi:hypothetical protein
MAMSIRRCGIGVGLLLGLLLLALFATSPVQAQQSSPEGSVFDCLTDAGYEVLDVYGDDEVAMVIMEPVSNDWDDDLRSQVVWGWYCLYPNYEDSERLISAVEYDNRYYLAFLVDRADLGDWLDGEMDDSDFASAYTYGVYDTQIEDWISETDFIHTYFPGAEPTIEEEGLIPRPGQQAGEPAFSDDFSDEDSGLPQAEEDEYEIGYVDGEYHINLLQEGQGKWMWYPDQEFDDFAVQVQARRVEGSDEGDYGLIVRVGPGGEEFYNFAINADGYYNIYKHESEGWTELVGFTRDRAIMGGGEWDLLRVEADGSSMSFLVNGKPLATVEDEDFTSGTIGFYAATYEDPEMLVAFDNLTVSTGEAPSEGWSLVLEDDFSDEGSGLTPHHEYDFGEVGYEDDEYHITVLAEDRVVWEYYEDAEFEDVAAEVEARFVEGPQQGSYGLLTRLDPDSEGYYYFGITADGMYGVFKHGGGHWTDLVDWTESPAIEGAGEWDLLRVEAIGSQLSFLVNGEPLATVEDDEFNSGAVALFAGSYDDPGVHAAFDNLKVYVPEGPPTGEPYFGPVTWYETIGANGEAQNPVTEYPRGTTRIIARWEYDNMEAGLEWGNTWLLDGEVFGDWDYEWQGGQSGAWLSSISYTRGDPLESGDWEVQLYIEGELVQSATTRIR